jgi:glycosyltransferase involved in cell wall biosynthesis
VRVLSFGTYERDYPRNAQVISCLRGAGVDVVEHHVPVWEGERDKFGLGIGSLARLARAELRLLRRPRASFDAVVVGYPGHADMQAARRVAAGRPVVFNPLVSLEDTIVGDRGLAGSKSVKARVLRAIDRQAFRGADLVVADTAAHARFFRERFGLASETVSYCYVGAEDRLFTPGPRETRELSILFVGKLIPLHGLETILAAAALCPEVRFRLVGSGQLEDVLESLPPNIHWDPWVAYEKLPALYRSAGGALGIFGTSDKAARVIPNKAFQALATATPLITADTTASRELLEDGRDALLVPPGDPEALADAVRRLASSQELAEAIGTGGRTTYETHASEAVLGARWHGLLDNLLRPHA